MTLTMVVIARLVKYMPSVPDSSVSAVLCKLGRTFCHLSCWPHSERSSKEAGAGAVGDDDFIKAFTDVPTVQAQGGISGLDLHLKRVEACSLDPAYFPLHESNFPKVAMSAALPTLSMQRWKQLTRNIATSTCGKQLKTEICANIYVHMVILESLETSCLNWKRTETNRKIKMENVSVSMGSKFQRESTAAAETHFYLTYVNTQLMCLSPRPAKKPSTAGFILQTACRHHHSEPA
ncbi:uncharacterized protein FN964_005806 [Alca torda]